MKLEHFPVGYFVLVEKKEKKEKLFFRICGFFRWREDAKKNNKDGRNGGLNFHNSGSHWNVVTYILLSILSLLVEFVLKVTIFSPELPLPCKKKQNVENTPWQKKSPASFWKWMIWRGLLKTIPLVVFDFTFYLALSVGEPMVMEDSEEDRFILEETLSIEGKGAKSASPSSAGRHVSTRASRQLTKSSADSAVQLDLVNGPAKRQSPPKPQLCK